jgi:hypothetical protein
MTDFPILQSGAVAQYPLPSASGQAVAIIPFIDGTDQRCLLQGQSFRRWEIKLSLLNDSEMAAVEAFFVQQQGSYGSFTFPDPISGVQVPNCKLANASLDTIYLGTNAGATSLWVIETNG